MGRKPKMTGPTARKNPEAFKQVLTRMSPNGWKALRMLALQEGTTLNALAIEAFNDLLRKYGKKASVENPLAE
jgi:predicted HicB family RNase H-like nuclease